MTFSWSPAIKEPIESDVWTEKFADFMINWVVTGMTPTDGGGGTLTIAAGTCWIDGWRVVTDGESEPLSDGNPRYVYAELTKDGGGKVVSIAIAEYGSPQTEDVRILIATPEVSGGSIVAVNDARQFDPIDPSMVRITDDVSLSDWRHASDLSMIDGAEIYTASIPWATVIKTGSNLNEIVTRSHTVLTGIGSNTHTAIDSHISDTSDPHGSTMSVSTKVTTPRIENSGDLTIESTAGHVYIKALGTGKNIYLSPSGKLYLDDDFVISGRVMTESGSLQLFSAGNMIIESGVEYIALDGTGGYVRVGVDTRSSTSSYDEGGIRPGSHEQGFLGYYDSGSIELAWRDIYGESIYDDDGSLGSYSEREDLIDLRKISEVLHPETGEKVRNSWGDPILDAGTLPEYIKRKQHIEAHVGTEREGRGYIKSARFKGWVISLFKKLDEIDTTQDDKLLQLFDELIAIKSRLDAIEQA